MRTFFLGLIGAGFVLIVIGVVLSLPFRREEVSVAAWLRAGPRLVSDIETFVRPERLVVVRGCLQAGLLMVVIGVAMMSVDGMVVRRRA